MRATVTNHARYRIRGSAVYYRVRAPDRGFRCQSRLPKYFAVSRTGEAQPADDARPSLITRVKDFFCPFHDAGANARFMALALGGMLCSIATLIHDSYLPVFMRDELGMSNSVRSSST